MTDLCLSQLVYPELKTTARLNFGSNFHVWRKKLEFVLVDNGVEYVLTEPKPSKDNESDAARHDKWVADNFTALHIILGSIHENLFLTHKEHESAKSLMDKLADLFTRPSMTRRMNLFRKYVTHRMKEGTPIIEHMTEMGAMANELALEGVKVPDEMQAVALMESLPYSWENVSTAVRLNLDFDKEDGKLSLENVIKKLRNAGALKEIEQQQSRRSRESEDSSSRGGSRQGFNGTCHACGEFGHRKADCPY